MGFGLANNLGLIAFGLKSSGQLPKSMAIMDLDNPTSTVSVEEFSRSKNDVKFCPLDIHFDEVHPRQCKLFDQVRKRNHGYAGYLPAR